MNERTVGARVLYWLGILLALASTSCAWTNNRGRPQQEVQRTLGVTGAGSALERLTSEPVIESHPTLSPDGATLLFEVTVLAEDGPARQQTLVAVNPDTRAQRTLFTSTNSMSNHPVWLPDQSSYVYTSNSPGGWSLVKALTASPNAAVSVIASGEIAPSASWPTTSPDGSKIAFGTVIRSNQNVAVIDIDGSNLTLLGEGAMPSWSPGGEQLAFVRSVNGYDHLFLVDAATGTGLVQLTSGEHNHGAPSWSPDGRFLVFTTDRGWKKFGDRKIRNLFILKKDGTGMTQLTDGNSTSGSPHWGRDGRIYFASDQAGNADIWRLAPIGQYASLQAASAAVSAAPAAAADPAAPAATAGCTKDTDCKGDRICEDGTCVSP